MLSNRVRLPAWLSARPSKNRARTETDRPTDRRAHGTIMTEPENTQTETAETAIEQTNIKRRENGRPATVVIQLTSPPADGETLRHESDDATVTVEADTDASSTRATLGDEDGYANVRVVLSKWEVQTLSTMGRARWEDGSGEHTTRFTITIGQALGERDAEESPFTETDDDETETGELHPGESLTGELCTSDFIRGVDEHNDDVAFLRLALSEWFGGCPNCGATEDARVRTWEDAHLRKYAAECKACANTQMVSFTQREINELLSEVGE